MTAQKVGDAAEDLEDKTKMDLEMTGGLRRRRSKSRRGGSKSPRHSRKSPRHSRKSRMGGKRKACPKYCRRKTLRCKTYRRAHKKSHRRRRR